MKYNRMLTSFRLERPNSPIVLFVVDVETPSLIDRFRFLRLGASGDDEYVGNVAIDND